MGDGWRGRRAEDQRSTDTLLFGAMLLLEGLSFLYASVMYGTFLVLAEADDVAGEWLRFVEWVDGFVFEYSRGSDAAAEHGGLRPGWLQEVLEALRNPERASPGFVDEKAFRDFASDELERLAMRARPIEEDGGDPLAEIRGGRSRAGRRLLGLMQDSLVLASTRDMETRLLMAGVPELLEHLQAARDEGVWEPLAV